MADSAEQEPKSTGEEPKSTGEEPKSTGEEPKSTEEEPKSTGEEPKSTEEEPKSTGEEPKSTGEEPKSTGEEPKSAGEEPKSTGEEPKSTGEEPKSKEEEPKSTGEEENVTEQDKKIIRQVEYYFGDMNLPRDRFLQDLIKKDDGWIPLETMTKFNRLKQITEDVGLIAAAMKKSTSGLIEINEDGTQIRRSPDKPMPENTEERRQDVSARTVYAKVFPLDISLDELMTFFEAYGPMETIFMRKDVNKDFKGSVFATFKSKEDMEKFLKEESVKYKDQELEARKTKADYYKQKQEEKKQHRENIQQKGQEARERQEDDHRNKIKNQMTKGAMFHMKGFSLETKREDIKNFLQDHGQVAWIDFNTGDTEAWVRYDEENMAPSVLEKLKEAMPDGIVLNNCTLECRVVEGEEEIDRWVKMFKDIAERKQAFKDKKSKYKQNKGGKNRYGKRPSKRTREAQKAEEAMKEIERTGAYGDEPPEKKTKNDEPAAAAVGE